VSAGGGVSFFCLGRILSSPGRSEGTVAVAGALVGILAGKACYLFLLEGRVPAEAIIAAALLLLLPAALMSRKRPDSRDRDAESVGEPKTAAGSCSATGSFLLGLALAALYPVARKILFQVATNVPETSFLIFSIALTGALLGVFFIIVFFSPGQWRTGGAVFSTALFVFGIFFLWKGFDFTQQMGDFGDFKRYIERFCKNYFPAMRNDILLYTALFGIPAFTAGAALCAVRGSWRAFLFGMAAGTLAGTRILPWTETSSDLVLQAGIAAAAASFFMTGRTFPAGPGLLSIPWRAACGLASAGALAVIVWCAAVHVPSGYPDIPIRGEVDLLLFRSHPGNDLRVTTSDDDEAMVRLDSGFVFHNRGIRQTAERFRRALLPFRLEGECLVAGPLAPVVAPIVLGGHREGLSPAALETTPALNGASRAVADHEGLDILPDDRISRETAAMFFARNPARFDNIVFLPRFSWIDSSRGFLSKEIFLLAREALAEQGAFWLFVDSTDEDGRAISSVAAAMSSVFPASALWLVEDGLLPPYLLCVGLKGRAGLDGRAVERAIIEDVKNDGLAEAGIWGLPDLMEFLLADPSGMAFLGKELPPASARYPVSSGSLFKKPPGWAAVSEIVGRTAEVVGRSPSPLPEKIMGLKVKGTTARHEARSRVLDGLGVHDLYKYQIDERHDLDWDLFKKEVGHYGAAFKACPQTAMGRRIVAALMPMLIDKKEYQIAYETIKGTAGEDTLDPVLRCYLGIAGFEMLDYEYALGHLEHAVERDPFFVDAAAYAGLCSFALEKMEESVRYLEIAMELDEERELIYKPLAMSLYDTGRVYEAAGACERALEISPDDEDLKSLMLLIRDALEER